MMNYTKRKVQTAEQSLKSWRLRFYTGGVETLEYDVKKAPLQYPTTERERTCHELTRPLTFGWANG